jgi:hypothetical protein
LGSALDGIDVAGVAQEFWRAVSVILIGGIQYGHTGQKLPPCCFVWAVTVKPMLA